MIIKNILIAIVFLILTYDYILLPVTPENKNKFICKKIYNRIIGIKIRYCKICDKKYYGKYDDKNLCSHCLENIKNKEIEII